METGIDNLDHLSIAMTLRTMVQSGCVPGGIPKVWKRFFAVRDVAEDYDSGEQARGIAEIYPMRKGEYAIPHSIALFMIYIRTVFIIGDDNKIVMVNSDKVYELDDPVVAKQLIGMVAMGLDVHDYLEIIKSTMLMNPYLTGVDNTFPALREYKYSIEPVINTWKTNILVSDMWFAKPKKVKAEPPPPPESKAPTEEEIEKGLIRRILDRVSYFQSPFK